MLEGLDDTVFEEDIGIVVEENAGVVETVTFRTCK